MNRLISLTLTQRCRTAVDHFSPPPTKITSKSDWFTSMGDSFSRSVVGDHDSPSGSYSSFTGCRDVARVMVVSTMRP
ncbi:unnamed protein product [Adineta ricciae]|uniref:Uncharacterized protein n=1 Tax=Adineta ricciae TaxID=249248 RepID=A0A815QPI1_ADIRI|nr:unnamed protein product [Adineta ricciae]